MNATKNPRSITTSPYWPGSRSTSYHILLQIVVRRKVVLAEVLFLISAVFVLLFRNLSEFQWLLFCYLQLGATFRALHLFEKNSFFSRHMYSRVTYRTNCSWHFSSPNPNSILRLSRIGRRDHGDRDSPRPPSLLGPPPIPTWFDREPPEARRIQHSVSG